MLRGHHSARGNAEHERVHRVAYETRQSAVRVEFALPVRSDRIGLIGKYDVVEFWPDGTVYPVPASNMKCNICRKAMCCYGNELEPPEL